MDFPKHIDKINMGLCMGMSNFQNFDVFMSLKIVMQHFIWVFTVCQSTCLLVSSIQIEKGLMRCLRPFEP